MLFITGDYLIHSPLAETHHAEECQQHRSAGGEEG
jgi:hypothetical protein